MTRLRLALTVLAVAMFCGAFYGGIRYERYYGKKQLLDEVAAALKEVPAQTKRTTRDSAVEPVEGRAEVPPPVTRTKTGRPEENYETIDAVLQKVDRKAESYKAPKVVPVVPAAPVVSVTGGLEAMKVVATSETAITLEMTTSQTVTQLPNARTTKFVGEGVTDRIPTVQSVKIRFDVKIAETRFQFTRSGGRVPDADVLKTLTPGTHVLRIFEGDTVPDGVAKMFTPDAVTVVMKGCGGCAVTSGCDGVVQGECSEK